MLLPQLLLIPILFMVQEITVRLGIVTGKGHGLLIREHFGAGWGYLSAGTLLLSSIGALLTEFAGVAGVGELFGVSRWLTIPVATVLLLAVGAAPAATGGPSGSASPSAWRARVHRRDGARPPEPRRRLLHGRRTLPLDTSPATSTCSRRTSAR